MTSERQQQSRKIRCQENIQRIHLCRYVSNVQGFVFVLCRHHQHHDHRPFKSNEDDEIGLAGDDGGVEGVEKLGEEKGVELTIVREWPFKHCK